LDLLCEKQLQSPGALFVPCEGTSPDLLGAPGNLYGRGKEYFSSLFANLDAISRLNEFRSLRPDALSDKDGVLARFPPRRTQMTAYIFCWHIAGQIEEKSVNALLNGPQTGAFPR
jgi:hypothetical protein